MNQKPWKGCKPGGLQSSSPFPTKVWFWATFEIQFQTFCVVSGSSTLNEILEILSMLGFKILSSRTLDKISHKWCATPIKASKTVWYRIFQKCKEKIILHLFNLERFLKPKPSMVRSSRKVWQIFTNDNDSLFKSDNDNSWRCRATSIQILLTIWGKFSIWS